MASSGDEGKAAPTERERETRSAWMIRTTLDVERRPDLALEDEVPEARSSRSSRGQSA
jgi:hypothetical protein